MHKQAGLIRLPVAGRDILVHSNADRADPAMKSISRLPML